MCGIAGYIGPKSAEAILIMALERLKYRGYDSAGMTVQRDGSLVTRRAPGKLTHLVARLTSEPLSGHCGIAHTRWATHGAPTEINCHPHGNNDGRIMVVHNGIIENHEALRHELKSGGAVFHSETDTEVIPHLVSSLYHGDPVAAVSGAIGRLSGSFAFAAMFADHPGRIIAARRGSPLLIGKGPGEVLLASDLPALLPHAREVCYLEDGQIGDLTEAGAVISTFAGDRLPTAFRPIGLTAESISKGDFDSFMAKEIAEQPEVLDRLIASRLRDGELVEPDLGIDLSRIDHVMYLGAGTSWHAAQLGKRFLEQIARVHAEADIASEYRYRNPVDAGNTVVVAISQSGETADTLAGLRLARTNGIPVIGLVNVVTSTIAREADGMMPLLAGPEIGVASTKAYTAQVLAMYLFALQVAKAKGMLSKQAEEEAITAMQALPDLAVRTLNGAEELVSEAADLFASAQATVFLGRGGEHATALEGALKLKEIAYVHAIGYPAGEFKHGPIALVSQALPVVCICPHDHMYEKMVSNLQEVRARAGRIIVVADQGDRVLADLSDHLFPVQKAPQEVLQPILSILPLQRYAYHIAQRRGCDVDQPRNLAKSVTVE